MLVVNWDRLDEETPLPMLVSDLENQIEKLCDETRMARIYFYLHYITLLKIKLF